MDATNDSQHFAKLSADLWINPKWNRLQAIDKGAALLWINALTFSIRQFNDGHTSSLAVRKLGGTPENVKHIIQVGMGTSDGADGFIIHDYAKYQVTRAEALKRHKKRSEAGKQGMKRRWAKKINPRKIDPNTGEITGDART